MTFGVTKKLVWIETGAKTHFIIYVPLKKKTGAKKEVQYRHIN